MKLPTPADILASERLLGDRLPRHIISAGFAPDECSHCGPYPTSVGFGDHLRHEHGISYSEYRDVTRDALYGRGAILREGPS